MTGKRPVRAMTPVICRWKPMACGRGPSPVDKRGGDNTPRWGLVGIVLGLLFSAPDYGPR